MEDGESLAADLKELNVEKVTRRGTRSKEEIEKLSLDERLGELERAQLLLQSSHPLQQHALVLNLPRLLCEDKAAMLQFLKDFSAFILRASSELQAQAAQTFNSMLADPTSNLRPQEIHESIMPLAMSFLNKLGTLETSVGDAWRETFLDSLRHMPVKALKTEILAFAVEKGQFVEKSANRILACQIFGRLAELIDAESIETGFFVQAMSMCQDTNYEVRCAMASQLAHIAAGISPSSVESTLLPELLELAGDEVVVVRLAAFDAAVNILDTLPAKLRRERIVPLLKQFCRETSDEVRLAVTQAFGKFLIKIAPDLPGDGDSLLFYETFKTRADKAEVELRRACAFNFPAVVKALGPQKYVVHLHHAFEKLALDNDPAVRRAVAAGLHEIAQMLGVDRTAVHLKAGFVALCADSSIQVVEVLLENLDIMLMHFCVAGEDERSRIFAELAPGMLKLESTAAPRWRVHIKLIRHFAMFHQCFGCNEIYEHFLPMLFRLMRSAPWQVQEEAARSVCMLIRNNKYGFQMRDLCQRLIREFGRGHASSQRLIFLEASQYILQLFSRRFFRVNFLEAFLSLADDRVPNVRLRVCELLPPVRKLLNPSQDAATISKISDCLTTLQGDSDRDVAAASNAAIAAIEKDQVEGVADPEADQKDQALEEEEQRLQDEDDDPGSSDIAMRRCLGDKGKGKSKARSLESHPPPRRSSSMEFLQSKRHATPPTSKTGRDRATSSGYTVATSMGGRSHSGGLAGPGPVRSRRLSVEHRSEHRSNELDDKKRESRDPAPRPRKLVGSSNTDRLEALPKPPVSAGRRRSSEIRAPSGVPGSGNGR